MTLKNAVTLFLAAMLLLAAVVAPLVMSAAGQGALALEKHTTISKVNAVSGASAVPAVKACGGCSGGGDGPF